jgi:hypothetical protein
MFKITLREKGIESKGLRLQDHADYLCKISTDPRNESLFLISKIFGTTNPIDYVVIRLIFFNSVITLNKVYY